MTDDSSPTTDTDSADDEDGAEFTHDPEPDATGSTHPDLEPDDPAGPLGELAAAVEESADSDRSRSDPPDFDDLFDREETPAIDSERLWERLEDDDPPLPSGPTDGAERQIREVEKRSYCQGCEYLADPPDVACTHEDAEILAVPSAATVRIADCPFVLEDEALEEER